MLAAILRGKVSSRVEGAEDLLTSVVFGAMEHLPLTLGVGPFLRRAAATEADALLAGVTGFRVEYWPWWNHDDEAAGAEPDVALWLELGGGGERLVVVEAKRMSGKSGVGPYDQLARQVVNGRALAGTGAFCGLIYLTAHIERPGAELKASAVALRDHFRRPPAPLWWASWRDLAPLLDRAAAEVGCPLRRRLCLDAAACLRRWGMQRFSGVSAVAEPPRFVFRRHFDWTVSTTWPQWAFSKREP